MLQSILIVIGVIIAVVFLLALIMKKEFTITSEVLINRPKDMVFDYVKHLRNQEKYSKWVMADPNVKLTYTGTDGTVGFKSAWVSAMKNVGIGEQEITKIAAGEKYEVEIRFEKPFKATNQAVTTTEAISPGQTKVTTTFKGRSAIPMNLMTAIFSKMVKKDMDENSMNLKRVLENG
ncbi:SRPBCC family protein [Flavihumibacter fluvii]|uniref:SRPBCC family protein n=1 Tax=Flavihumibacter fluvii TaxID=2838157 RepID=UPI001BDF3127|nr:SRPBCC family protein [Flavihumibacter fluvii]ULQ51864.1 SRPBCC family protein [Flavihumibacter fluvii]